MLSASTSGLTGVAQGRACFQSWGPWCGQRARRCKLPLLPPGSFCACGDCWCQPSETGRTSGWHAAYAARQQAWQQQSPRQRPNALQPQGLQDHRVAHAGSCCHRNLVPRDALALLRLLRRKGVREVGRGGRSHRRRRGGLVGAPAECSQHLWSLVHGGGPMGTQCPRHSDLEGVRALLPNQCWRPPQSQPSTTPGQTLCGGSALAFSTSLRQSGLRRQPSRRQRPEQRPEEAGGEEAPLLAALEQHSRAGRKGQSSTAPCSAPGGGPEEFKLI